MTRRIEGLPGSFTTSRENICGVETTMTKMIGYGVGGFTLSVLFSVVAGLGLQFIVNSIWVHPESFITVYGATFVIAIAAVTLTWSCLLRGLTNEAMIRGVWIHIYAIAMFSIVGLVFTLFV